MLIFFQFQVKVAKQVQKEGNASLAPKPFQQFAELWTSYCKSLLHELFSAKKEHNKLSFS